MAKSAGQLSMFEMKSSNQIKSNANERQPAVGAQFAVGRRRSSSFLHLIVFVSFTLLRLVRFWLHHSLDNDVGFEVITWISAWCMTSGAGLDWWSHNICRQLKWCMKEPHICCGISWKSADGYGVCMCICLHCKCLTWWHTSTCLFYCLECLDSSLLLSIFWCHFTGRGGNLKSKIDGLWPKNK